MSASTCRRPRPSELSGEQQKGGEAIALLAATDRPFAAIAIAGVAFLTIVLGVALWQIFGTGRTAIRSQQDRDYRKLVDELLAG